MKRPSRILLVLSPLVVSLACAGPDEPVDEIQSAITVPSKGTATTFDIGSWNIEWFGDPGNGPSNEPLQLSNVRDVIAGTDFDLWGLEGCR